MFSFLPGPLIGLFSFFLYTINTLFWLIPIIVFSFLKAISFLSILKKFFSLLLDQMASNWVAVNTGIQKLFYKIKINTKGLEKLKLNGWYLVLSNHQSWVDIVVLQRILHGKIPFLKFFLKRELLYVPFLGIAWWALDFPFMNRYSQSYLRKNPHLIGKDFETTRKACEKFKHKPVSVMNFMEGTRFTPEKYAKQKPKFKHLLRPKAGGVAYVFGAMGQHLSKVVDVTIHYPDGIPSFKDFVTGKVENINVIIKTIEVNDELLGDYYNDKRFKQSFQQWINDLWIEKDKTLEQLTQETN